MCTGVLTLEWGIEKFRPSMIPPTRKLTFYGMTNRGSAGDEDEAEVEKLENMEKNLSRCGEES